MHVDARELEDGSVIEGDICIVGAGAAGIGMALEWINTPYKVVLLEGGGFAYEDSMQELYRGKITGQRYFPLKAIRLHYFGGTTGHWAGFCSTFDDIDFEKRDYVHHSGWPITRAHLDPFYERAQKILELGPYEYSADYWMRQHPEFVPLDIDEKIVWNKMWQFSPPTRFGKKYRDPIVNAKNIHLYTYANVVTIVANDHVSSIQEVVVRNLAGKEHRVKAKYFVLACCAVQNARLLLASHQQATKGLGNDHDLVGRFFMEHLEMKSAELWLGHQEAMKMYMWTPGVKARAELAISAQQQREHQILNGTASLIPLDLAKSMPAFIDMWDEEGNRIKDFSDEKEDPKAAQRGYKAFQLFTRIEQSPNPLSRVTIDNERDALNMPRASLHWDLTPLEKRSIRKIYEIIGRELGKAGIGRVRLMTYLRDENDDSWPALTGGGWHHMGTTRMHENQKEGVVDKNCKVHSLSNLYIAGSSCFPTAGAPNPTLTLLALTLRLSDHLKSKVTAVS
jgi:choline dehydrogenase-like flavoprotein